MKIQDKFAFVRALKDALAEEDKWLAQELICRADDLGTDRFTTPLGGKITIAGGEDKVRFEDGGLLAWMREHQPYNVQTVEVVRAKASEALLADCEVVDAQVIHKPSGEVLDFAKVVPGNRYPTWRGKNEAVANVKEWLRGRVDALAGDAVKAVEAPEVETNG